MLGCDNQELQKCYNHMIAPHAGNPRDDYGINIEISTQQRKQISTHEGKLKCKMDFNVNYHLGYKITDLATQKIMEDFEYSPEYLQMIEENLLFKIREGLLVSKERLSDPHKYTQKNVIDIHNGTVIPIRTLT